MDGVFLREALLEATASQRCDGSVTNITTCAPRCSSHASIILTIISSVGSVIGSLLIIGTFLKWKDLRTVARMILVFLAIADLLTSLGYMFGAAINLQYRSPTRNCTGSISTSYTDLCIAQSFLTTVMPMASFFWTANLTVYLFFAIGLKKIDFAKKLMIPFHVIAWGIPLVTCTVIMALNQFGASDQQSSGPWCWIKNNINSSNSLEEQRRAYKMYFIMEFMAGKMWEMAVCVLSLTLCVIIKVQVWRRYRVSKVTPS